MLTTHPRRRRRVRPPADVAMNQQLLRIKARLKAEGYKLRASFNDTHAWKITHPDRPGFHLLCNRNDRSWVWLPHEHTPEREQLIAWVQEAIGDE